MSYIYIAENLKKPLDIVNGEQRYKSYIGFTRASIEKRFSEENTFCGHYYRAFVLGYNSKFYCALRKYGKENFRIRCLEELDTKDISLLKEREIYWISLYNSYENGYNSTPGGDCNFKLSDITRQNISKALKGKKWTEERKKLYKKKIDRPEIHEKRHQLNLKLWQNYGDKLRASRASEDYREKMRQISKEVRQREDYKEKMYNIMHSQEYHDNMSKAVKQALAKPEVKEKLSKSVKKAYESEELRKKIGDSVRKAFDRPGVREKRSKAISNALSGTKLMNNGVYTKYVKKENIDDYLKEGWTYGKLKK